MSRGRRKDLYRRESDSLERPHEKAEIQRKVLRLGKNLAFSEDTCLEKERVRSKMTPRKVGVGLKRRREPSRRRLGWRLARWGSTVKKEASHLLGLRGRHQYSDQRSNRNRINFLLRCVHCQNYHINRFLDSKVANFFHIKHFGMMCLTLYKTC